MNFQKLFRSWHLWIVVAVITGVLFFQKTFGVTLGWPLALVLLCPIMMIFMMGSHKDHKH